MAVTRLSGLQKKMRLSFLDLVWVSRLQLDRKGSHWGCTNGNFTFSRRLHTAHAGRKVPKKARLTVVQSGHRLGMQTAYLWWWLPSKVITQG